MRKYDLIEQLRPYLSWGQIAEIIYGDRRKKLQVYGLWLTYRRRQLRNIENNDNVILDNELYSDNHVGNYLGTMQNKEIRKIMIYTDEARRERHKLELHRLIDAFYNILGMGYWDQKKLLLSNLHETLNSIIKNIEIDKATADIKSVNISSGSVEALACVYVVFYIATYNTIYHTKMKELWDIIKRIAKRKKKIDVIRKRIGELKKELIQYILY